jgi:hypothetical protein
VAEQLQRHRAKLVSALYEARADYGFAQAVRDGFMIPVESESASGYTPRHKFLLRNLDFSLDRAAAREKELLARYRR